MGTKNNPKNRGVKKEGKKIDNKEIEPVLYHGVHAGHGKYIAAKFSGSGQLVLDAHKRPVQWDQVP